MDELRELPTLVILKSHWAFGTGPIRSAGTAYKYPR